MNTREQRELRQRLASRIKALRGAAEMTQEELSEKADIATQYLCRLEDAHQVPSLYAIVDIAKALDILPSAVLGDPVGNEHDERFRRLAEMLGLLNEEDAAFLESRVADWVSYLKNRSQ